MKAHIFTDTRLLNINGTKSNCGCICVCVPWYGFKIFSVSVCVKWCDNLSGEEMYSIN
jgi:hypothetical protein